MKKIPFKDIKYIPKKFHRRKKSSLRKLKRLLAKKYNIKHLTPKRFRQMRTVNKVIKSVQRHQETYLTGLSAALYALKKWAR